ncbi:Isoleucine--tRNA ligase [Labeo rohita]|uniref:Isoleucine--tRNA ligase n=1 Tax=Labeo rohita TaxID=84645 RepID=A0ABQ8L6S7_LABRO|nr:Isoleucine--tRNA ligase [Labeo rohita]
MATGDSFRTTAFSYHVGQTTVSGIVREVAIGIWTALGDEVYPVMMNLLRPYPGHHIPPERRVFNYCLSQARLVVECAFSIRCPRWQMYRQVITSSPEVPKVCGQAICVLQNFLHFEDIGKGEKMHTQS